MAYAAGAPYHVAILTSPDASCEAVGALICERAAGAGAALVAMAAHGLVTAELLLRCLLLAPAVEIGQRLGHRLYGVVGPATVKRAALAMLVALAVVAIGRSVGG